MIPKIDFYPLFVIPLAAFLEFIFQYLVLALFQLFQTYQYNTNVLPYEYINKDKYGHLFLKSSQQFRYVYIPDHEFRPQKKLGKIYFDRVVSKQDSVIQLYFNHKLAFDRYEILAEKWSIFIPLDSLKHTLYAEISCEVCVEDPTSDASLVTAFQENWKAYFWERKFLVHQVMEKNIWTPIRFILTLPKYRPKESHFSISLHNKNPLKIKARKLRVRIFTE